MKTDLLMADETLQALDAYLARPTQALLLTGKSGTGKSLIAENLAEQLLGLTHAQLVNYPYLRRLDPIDGKISIEQVRSLASFVQLVVPGAADVARIICIIDAELMTREAQNALLKLLEEPPTRTVILMTASQPRRLLPTIISRLQKVVVRTPDEANIIRTYIARGFTETQVKRAYMLSEGSIAQLESLLHGDDASNSMVDLVKRALSSEAFERMSLIDTVLKDKSVARQFVDTLTVVSSSSLRHTSQMRWHRALEASITAQTALAKNANQKLVLTALMLSI